MSTTAKTFYFVRHGESKSNVSRILVGAESPLTERGEKQSFFLAKRFESITIDVIVASPFVRTKQTAEIFNNVLNKPIEFSDLIVECRYPSTEYGLHENDPERLALSRERVVRREEPGWRNSDEENFEDLKERGLQALHYLQERPEEKIVVITHGGFLRVMIACMLFGNELIAKEYYNLLFFLHTTNTGITLCEYDPDRVTRPGWWMTSFNDFAHLGEVD